MIFTSKFWEFTWVGLVVGSLMEFAVTFMSEEHLWGAVVGGILGTLVGIILGTIHLYE